MICNKKLVDYSFTSGFEVEVRGALGLAWGVPFGDSIHNSEMSRVDTLETSDTFITGLASADNFRALLANSYKFEKRNH